MAFGNSGRAFAVLTLSLCAACGVEPASSVMDDATSGKDAAVISTATDDGRSIDGGQQAVDSGVFDPCNMHCDTDQVCAWAQVVQHFECFSTAAPDAAAPDASEPADTGPIIADSGELDAGTVVADTGSV